MGHPAEIFTSSPPDNTICPVCHDVMKDAVSMRGCGHTFCEECAKACLRTPCPNCRHYIEDYDPCYFARETIGLMKVKCPHDEKDDGEEENKRRRGENGDIIPKEVCNWIGDCKDLTKHEDVCEFKTITCVVDGCNYQCRRKDMKDHLSGDGVRLHMDLMRRSVASEMQQKMVEMQQKMDQQSVELQQTMDQQSVEMQQKMDQQSSQFDKKIKSLKKKINEMQEDIDSLNMIVEAKDDASDDTIEVGCNRECNYKSHSCERLRRVRSQRQIQR